VVEVGEAESPLLSLRAYEIVSVAVLASVSARVVRSAFTWSSVPEMVSVVPRRTA